MTMGPGDVRAAAESLAAILARIDSGELRATSQERAYLEGAADTLARLADGAPPAA